MREEMAGWCALCKSRCGATFTVEDGRLVGAGPLPEHPTGKSSSASVLHLGKAQKSMCSIGRAWSSR
jgi:hypothetical protein